MLCMTLGVFWSHKIHLSLLFPKLPSGEPGALTCLSHMLCVGGSPTFPGSSLSSGLSVNVK